MNVCSVVFQLHWCHMMSFTVWHVHTCGDKTFLSYMNFWFKGVVGGCPHSSLLCEIVPPSLFVTQNPLFLKAGVGKLTSWYANRGNQNGSNSFLCKQHKGSKVRFKLVSTPDRFRAKTRCAVSLKILVWKCLLLCRTVGGLGSEGDKTVLLGPKNWNPISSSKCTVLARHG